MVSRIGSGGRRAMSRSAGTRGAYDRGTCPVCRGLIALRTSNGKIMPHGKSAASPSGCAGNGEAPLRERKQPLGKLPVSSIGGPSVPHDEPPVPEIGIEVLVEPRNPPEVPVHLRPPPAGGAA